MGYGLSNVSVSAPLTNYITKYSNDPNNFIATKVLTPLSVTKEIGKYYIFGVENMSPSNDALRAAGSEANRSKAPVPSTNTYQIQEYALHDYVPGREDEEADVVLQPRQNRAAEIYEQVQIKKEISCAGMFNATSSFLNYTSLASGSQWSYTSTTTPVDNITTGYDACLKACGRAPNKMVIGGDVWTILRNHGSILDRIKYTQKGTIGEDLIAGLTGIPEVYVGKAVYGTGKETTSFFSANAAAVDSQGTSFIWGKNVSLLYQSSRPDLRSFSFGYCLTKRGGNITVKEEFDTKKDSYWIEVGDFWDFRITATAAAYNIFGAVA